MDFVITVSGYKLLVEPEIMEELNLKPNQEVSDEMVVRIKEYEAAYFIRDMDKRAAMGEISVDTTSLKEQLSERGFKFHGDKWTKPDP